MHSQMLVLKLKITPMLVASSCSRWYCNWALILRQTKLLTIVLNFFIRRKLAYCELHLWKCKGQCHCRNVWTVSELKSCIGSLHQTRSDRDVTVVTARARKFVCLPVSLSCSSLWEAICILMGVLCLVVDGSHFDEFALIVSRLSGLLLGAVIPKEVGARLELAA